MPNEWTDVRPGFERVREMKLTRQITLSMGHIAVFNEWPLTIRINTDLEHGQIEKNFTLVSDGGPETWEYMQGIAEQVAVQWMTELSGAMNAGLAALQDTLQDTQKE